VVEYDLPKVDAGVRFPLPAPDQILCRCGGTGRHAGLKIPYSQECESSSLSDGTTILYIFDTSISISRDQRCRDGGMVDTKDLKSFVSNDVRVRVPLPAPQLNYKTFKRINIFYPFLGTFCVYFILTKSELYSFVYSL
jgi:hypothetical protein